mmetsp:Transcript_7691/g.24664  ORF Transcript_7691/g.24664 Transcript_7691/m.24664 type:complete len:200 (-) Transcript_7691:609-1208(-)
MPRRTKRAKRSISNVSKAWKKRKATRDVLGFLPDSPISSTVSTDNILGPTETKRARTPTQRPHYAGVDLGRRTPTTKRASSARPSVSKSSSQSADHLRVARESLDRLCRAMKSIEDLGRSQAHARFGVVKDLFSSVLPVVAKAGFPGLKVQLPYGGRLCSFAYDAEKGEMVATSPEASSSLSSSSGGPASDRACFNASG